MDLLTDAEARDALLDDPRLFATVLEHGAPLSISPQLYFYLLVRHVLKETGLNDRTISDYVAAMLARFSDSTRITSPAGHSGGPIQYVSDMLVALRHASPERSFRIRAYMGDYTLFITGIFRERVEARSQHRGAPDLSFYESVGSESFRAASRHQEARSWELSGVYEKLADGFRGVRQALNRLSDSLLHLDHAHAPALPLI